MGERKSLRLERGGIATQIQIKAATELRQHITDPEVRKAQQEAERNITPLQGEDIAAAIVYAVTQPEHVSISEMLIRPTEQV